MKLPPRQVEKFLQKPDAAIRAVLLFGPDQGLVRERGTRLAQTVVADLRDAFRVTEFPASILSDDPARLADEAAAIAFGGGRRVVRITGAGDRFAALFEGFLEAPIGDALVVVEGGELAAKSSLRQTFEESPHAAAIACYPDDASTVELLVETMLREAGLGIAPDALDYLKENLGGDRQITRSEIEKLILYKGKPKDRAAADITLEDCMANVGDSAAVALEDVAYATASGDVAALDRAIGRSLLGGDSPVAILRSVQRHLQRLHLVLGSVDQDGAVRRQRINFKREAAFRAQLKKWNTGRVAQALDLLTEAELDCKSTGMPDEAICRRALLRLAIGARQSSRG